MFCSNKLSISLLLFDWKASLFGGLCGVGVDRSRRGLTLNKHRAIGPSKVPGIQCLKNNTGVSLLLVKLNEVFLSSSLRILYYYPLFDGQALCLGQSIALCAISINKDIISPLTFHNLELE